MASKDGTPTPAGFVESAKTTAVTVQKTVVDAATNVVNTATEYGKQAGAYVMPPEKKKESKVEAAATNIVDGAKEYGTQAQKGIGTGVEEATAQVEKLKTEVPAKIEEIKKGGEKEDKKDEGVFGGVKNFAAGLTK